MMLKIAGRRVVHSRGCLKPSMVEVMLSRRRSLVVVVVVVVAAGVAEGASFAFSDGRGRVRGASFRVNLSSSDVGALFINRDGMTRGKLLDQTPLQGGESEGLQRASRSLTRGGVEPQKPVRWAPRAREPETPSPPLSRLALCTAPVHISQWGSTCISTPSDIAACAPHPRIISSSARSFVPRATYSSKLSGPFLSVARFTLAIDAPLMI